MITSFVNWLATNRNLPNGEIAKFLGCLPPEDTCCTRLNFPLFWFIEKTAILSSFGPLLEVYKKLPSGEICISAAL